MLNLDYRCKIAVSQLLTVRGELLLQSVIAVSQLLTVREVLLLANSRLNALCLIITFDAIDKRTFSLCTTSLHIISIRGWQPGCLLKWR